MDHENAHGHIITKMHTEIYVARKIQKQITQNLAKAKGMVWFYPSKTGPWEEKLDHEKSIWPKKLYI